MYEQDYIMRLIKEFVRAVLKIVFGLDSESPMETLFQDTARREALDEYSRLVDEGRIDEAENRIFELAEKGNKEDLGTILMFFSYLNEKSEDFLEEHNFSREEIMEDLKQITRQYGIADMSDLFLQP